MNRREFLKTVPALAVLTAAGEALSQTGAASPPGRETAGGPAASQPTATGPASAPAAGALAPIQLVKPEFDGGKSVLAALKERKTVRQISDKTLPPQVLSNLLWAAFGVNRAKVRGQLWRTAASASNAQEIDLYVALPEGVYLYEAEPHRLAPVVEGDQRARCGRGAAAKAPVNLIFVADVAKLLKAPFQEPRLKDEEMQKSYYHIDAGLIAGNVHLFAAAQDLAAWFHNCDRPGLARALNLRPEQHVLYAQTVGYPA